MQHHAVCVTFTLMLRSDGIFPFVEKVYESNYKSNIDSVPIALNTNIREQRAESVRDETENMYCLKYTKVLIYCSLVKYIVANILTDLATVISSVQTISKENRTMPRMRSQILIRQGLTSIISYLTQKVFLPKISFNGKINIPPRTLL